MGQDRLTPTWPWIRATAMMLIFVASLSVATLRTRPLATPVKASNASADSDVDWNHVNDFWGGVRTLYTMTAAEPVPGSVLRLIERSLEESEK